MFFSFFFWGGGYLTSFTNKRGSSELIEICSEIVGQLLEKLLELAQHNNILRLSNNIYLTPNISWTAKTNG